MIIKDKAFEVFITEDEIQAKIKHLADTINTKYDGKDLLFLSVLNGAFMFTSDLLKSIHISCEISFVKVSSYSGTTTRGRVDELIGLGTSITDRHVIILEDIVDTGITIDKVKTLLRLESPASVAVCSLLFKPQAFQGKKEPDYHGFSIPNRFVVGYGLDYDGLGRNLKEIYQLKS
jgi:hypoxanthine phosphoribosyltransferase